MSSRTRMMSRLVSRCSNGLTLGGASHASRAAGWVSLTLIAALTFPAVSRSDDAEELFQRFRFFQGNWKIEVEIEGKKSTETARCIGTVGNCNIWFGEQATSIHGFDPKTKSWRSVVHFKDGSRMERVIAKSPPASIVAGTQLAFSDTTLHPDGRKTYATVAFTCLGPDGFREVTTRKDQDGKQLPTVTSIVRRVKSR